MHFAPGSNQAGTPIYFSHALISKCQTSNLKLRPYLYTLPSFSFSPSPSPSVESFGLADEEVRKALILAHTKNTRPNAYPAAVNAIRGVYCLPDCAPWPPPPIRAPPSGVPSSAPIATMVYRLAYQRPKTCGPGHTLPTQTGVREMLEPEAIPKRMVNVIRRPTWTEVVEDDVEALAAEELLAMAEAGIQSPTSEIKHKDIAQTMTLKAPTLSARKPGSARPINEPAFIKASRL